MRNVASASDFTAQHQQSSSSNLKKQSSTKPAEETKEEEMPVDTVVDNNKVAKEPSPTTATQ